MRQHWNWSRTALALWLIPAMAIAIWVTIHPLYRSMTPIYHTAVANWWAHQPVYSGSKEFNYLPSFLPVFSLFSSLPLSVGEILWRWIALGGLCLGLWQCTGLMTTTNRDRTFVLITVLTLPICASALRNGQSSAQLAACLVLTAWCLRRQRWWLATLWLSIALICKPLAIPAIGLAVMAYPRLWWRALLGTLVVLMLPYLFAPANYVNELYTEFASNLVDCFDPVGRTFADLNGVLMPLRLKLTGWPSLIVRVSAGGAMALGCWYTGRFGTDIRRVLLWLGFTGIYIMLFTPMNEANSYVMLAPALGLWTGWYVEHDELRMAQVLLAMCLTILFLPDLVGMTLEKQAGNEFAKFWCPLMTLGFLGILLIQLKLSPAKAN